MHIMLTRPKRPGEVHKNCRYFTIETDQRRPTFSLVKLEQTGHSVPAATGRITRKVLARPI